MFFWANGKNKADQRCDHSGRRPYKGKIGEQHSVGSELSTNSELNKDNPIVKETFPDKNPFKTTYDTQRKRVLNNEDDDVSRTKWGD